MRVVQRHTNADQRLHSAMQVQMHPEHRMPGSKNAGPKYADAQTPTSQIRAESQSIAVLSSIR